MMETAPRQGRVTQRNRGDLLVAQPWERLSGESAKAFEAFVVYRDAGADRSLAKVAQQLGKSTTLIERWSARDSWVLRAESWDVEQDRIWRAQQIASRREIGRRHLRIANAMQQRLVDGLAKLDVSKMSPRDISTWLEVSSKVQRAAIGLGDRVEHTGAGGGPIELATLTPEESRARLLEVHQEMTRRLAADPDAIPLEGAL